MRSYDAIKQAVLAKGYKWYEGVLNLNFIWERESDEYTNKFTDFLHLCYTDVNGKNQAITLPATTKPGLKGSILEPVTVEGITGTAVIVPGQYLSAWQFKDTYKEFSKYPYFRQVGKVDYWRDGDKDLEIDNVNFRDDKIYGTHWHIMSNPGTYGSGLVNNWSLGCMGTPEPEYVKILPVVRDAVRMHGDLFTGTIMESVDFQ